MRATDVSRAAAFAQHHPDHEPGVYAGRQRAGELTGLVAGHELPQLADAAQHQIRAKTDKVA